MSLEFNSGAIEIIGKLDRLNNKLRRMNVGSDIDGVEVNSAESALEILNFDKGKNYQLSEIISYWGLSKLVERDFPDIINPIQFAVDLYNSDRCLSQSNPIPGALLLSKFLNDQGINGIHRITSRPSGTRNVTMSWYKQKMPWVDRNKIHIQTDNNVINSAFKVQEIKNETIELFFEDSYEHAEEITSQTEATVLLVPQAWNAGYKPVTGSNIIIVPGNYYPHYPTMIRSYLRLADILV